MSITVIYPFYNNEACIKKSLLSIINQSYKSWKIILINDCSKDDSLKIVKEILKKQNISKKKYILINNKNNIGITKCLNLALKISKSKFIARADADDFYHRHRFKIQMDFLKKNSYVDVVGTNANIININGKLLEKVSMPSSDKMIKKILVYRNVFFHSSIIARREFFKRNNFYNAIYPNAQDYDLWLRGYKNSTYANINKYLIFYRRDYKNFSISKIKCSTLIRFKFLIREKLYLRGFYLLLLNITVDLSKYLKGKLF